MTKISGADPALAKAEPVARLGPAGFDPGEWVILTEENVAIRFERHEYHTDFRVFDVALTTHYADGKPQAERWEIFDGGDSWTLEAWADAFWQIRGSVKWDGCINWETNPECMAHGCGPRYVENIAAIFSAIYAYNKRHFDMLGDEAPPMPQPFLEIARIEAGTDETRNAAQPEGREPDKLQRTNP